jgi:hypothetical protein
MIRLLAILPVSPALGSPAADPITPVNIFWPKEPAHDPR